MNTKAKFIAAVAALQLVATAAFAADKTYQVTGPVLEVTDKSIVVEKSGERWEIVRDAAAKSKGAAPKVGDKVTIQYKMVATSIDNQGPAKKK
jgi:hypothetical protein